MQRSGCKRRRKICECFDKYCHTYVQIELSSVFYRTIFAVCQLSEEWQITNATDLDETLAVTTGILF